MQQQLCHPDLFPDDFVQQARCEIQMLKLWCSPEDGRRDMPASAEGASPGSDLLAEPPAATAAASISDAFSSCALEGNEPSALPALEPTRLDTAGTSPGDSAVRCPPLLCPPPLKLAEWRGPPFSSTLMDLEAELSEALRSSRWGAVSSWRFTPTVPLRKTSGTQD